MNTYYLTRLASGRVIISPVSTGAVIREIRADSWIRARLEVSDHEFYHNPGHGWF